MAGISRYREVPLVSDSIPTSSPGKRITRDSDWSMPVCKNLGPSGLALVLVREDLLGLALPQTPKLLDYQLA